MNTDNIDRFGHCVICHKNLITKRVIDGRLEETFLPIHGHTTFLLDNGSQMEVCMCKPCQEKTDLTDPMIHENIMEACLKGWDLETKILVSEEKWTKDHGEQYLKNMSFLNIDCHSQNLATSFIEERIKILTGETNVTDISS